jgi:hypothetical protein
MKNVYVLTSGDDLESYHIVGIYSTKELAEQAQKHCPVSIIETYELDSKNPPVHPQGHTAWHVEIHDKTNEISWCEQVDSLEYGFEPSEHHYKPAWHKHHYYQVKCWATDKEHAEEIAMNKFQQWKENNENEVH